MIRCLAMLVSVGALSMLSAGCCDSESSGSSRGEGAKVTAPATAKASAPTSTPIATAKPTQAQPVADPPEVANQNKKATPVRFEKGASSATIEGGVPRGERAAYSLGARQGQTMEVSISSVEDNAVFTLYEPDGTIIRGTEEENDVKKWKGTLPHNGAYVIDVGATRGGASFKMTVSIK